MLHKSKFLILIAISIIASISSSMATTLLLTVVLFSTLLLLSSVAASQSKVRTFTYANDGEFGPYVAEYGADYRVLPVAASPFQLAFYNTTPGEFFLALRMGTVRSESVFRWVWEANPGRPVRDNATFSLLPDGNLVLSDADRRVVWSTGTAHRGVVGLKIIPDGNVVLYDAKNRSVWQSFDHPTDTLLVGQSLNLVTGPKKLVSRRSTADGSFGTYSLVLSSGGLTLFMNDDQLTYYNYSDGLLNFASNNSVALECEPETEEKLAYELRLATGQGTIILARPKYDAKLSFLRLEIDGNLAVYTYYDPVDYRAWEKTFALFSDEIGFLSTCALPQKCREFGVCEDGMCVACPSPGGLLGWSKKCAPSQPPRPCESGAAAAAAAAEDYYKVVGVESFVSAYMGGEGRVSVEECRRRCGARCTCEGFAYWEEEGKCWLAPVLGTLKKVENSSHVVHVKYYKSTN